jgi:uncharacterized membrane protein YbhN (UPF0104 family)
MSAIFVAGFLIWAVRYVAGHWDEFSVIREVRAWHIAGLIACMLLMLSSNLLFIRTALVGTRVTLSVAEAGALVASSSFANYLLPVRGGAGMRAAYLWKRHGLAITTFLATIGVYSVMQVAVSSVMGLAGMLLILLDSGRWNTLAAAFFGGAAVLGWLAIPLLGRLPLLPESRYLAHLQGIVQYWIKLRDNRAARMKLWGLSCLLGLTVVAQSYLAFLAVSVPLSAPELMVFSGAKNLGALAGLTPGGLGVQEAIAIYLGQTLSYTGPQVLAVQALIRGSTLIVLTALAPAAFIYLRNRLAEPASPPRASTET